MKRLLFLASFLCIISCVQLAPASEDKNDVNCEDLLMKGDHAFNKIMFLGDTNVTHFTSKQDLKERYCEPFLGWIKTISNYTKCLKAFSKSVLNIVLSNIKKIHKNSCFDDAKLSEAYSHAKCMDSENKEKIASTVNIGVAYVQFISELPNVDDIIPALCCGSVEYFKSIESIIDASCRSKTGPNTGKYILGLIRNVFSDAMDLMCGKFPTEQSCQSQIPELFKQVSDSMKQNKHYNHSLAIPLVEMVKRLDSVTL